MKNIVACVLKLGGEVYDTGYVNALATAVKRHLTVDYEFVCLTDSTDPFCKDVHRTIPLNHALPGWWSKIELFNQPSFTDSKVLFFDLDTVLVDNIDFIFAYTPSTLIALEDFYFEENLGSGVMYYIGESINHLYDKFMESPMSIIRNTPTGDQTWIKDNMISYQRFQHVFPRKFVSFKTHCLANRNDYSVINIPTHASVVCFHGVPKPHNITNLAISNHWIRS